MDYLILLKSSPPAGMEFPIMRAFESEMESWLNREIPPPLGKWNIIFRPCQPNPDISFAQVSVAWPKDGKREELFFLPMNDVLEMDFNALTEKIKTHLHGERKNGTDS